MRLKGRPQRYALFDRNTGSIVSVHPSLRAAHVAFKATIPKHRNLDFGQASLGPYEIRAVP